jgi:hypothetical protein
MNNKGIHALMLEYENAKRHYFDMFHKGNEKELEKAMDIYMATSNAYHHAKNKKATVRMKISLEDKTR